MKMSASLFARVAVGGILGAAPMCVGRTALEYQNVRACGQPCFGGRMPRLRRKEKEMKSKENGSSDAVLPLCELAAGESAIIEGIYMPSTVRLRLSDLGMHKGACVICLGASPLGDPRAYLVRGRTVAIRGKDAKNIKCKP